MDLILNSPEYAGIQINRDELLNSIGLYLDKNQFLDLSQIPYGDMYDLLLKSIVWMEKVSDALSRAEKLKLDEELERDVVMNRVLSTIQTKRVSEAKAAAKSHADYISANKRYNALVAYVDYLKRLLVNLEKYHYVIKSRVEAQQAIERKY